MTTAQMNETSEIRLLIEFGRVTETAYPRELEDHLTSQEFSDRTRAFQEMYSRHRARTWLNMLLPCLFSVSAIALSVPLILRYTKDQRVERLLLALCISTATIFASLCLWLQVSRAKREYERHIHKLTKQFNNKDTLRSGISWRFQRVTKVKGEASQEFLVINLPWHTNVSRLSSITVSSVTMVQEIASIPTPPAMIPKHYHQVYGY